MELEAGAVSHLLLFLEIPTVKVGSGLTAADPQPSGRDPKLEAAPGRSSLQESCRSGVHGGGNFRGMKPPHHFFPEADT